MREEEDMTGDRGWMTMDETYADLSALKNKELDRYIARLRQMRINDKGSVAFSVNEITALLILASAEKNSRTHTKLVRSAMVIAFMGVIIAYGDLVFSFFGLKH